MLTEPTVLIVGAGASFDFGLPIGATLAGQIRESLSFEWDSELTRGDRALLDAARQAGVDVDRFLQDALKIAAALPWFKSIDDCLHTNSHNELGVLAGKMAIARQIALAESVSSIAKLWGTPRERQGVMDALRRTWAGDFVQLLVTGVTHADHLTVFDNLKVVSFNYDRCIESLLYHLIQPALDITAEQAAEAMQRLRVYHPYGSLGPIPALSPNRQGVRYGGVAGLNLSAAAERLFVYTEAREEPADLAEMKQAVFNAQKLLFLGFGFHEQNVKLLQASDGANAPHRIFATVMGEHNPAIMVYQERVMNLLGAAGPITMVDKDCSSFFQQYGVALSG